MSAPEHADVTAVILAGGQGNRLGGKDKGLLDFRGKPLIAHLIASVRPQTSNILINANRNEVRYKAFGFPVIRDSLQDFQGPLAGLAAAMTAAPTPFIISMPCDTPCIPEDYIKRMRVALQNERKLVAVAHDGSRLQPIHALVSCDLLADLELFLTTGQRSTKHWLQQHKPVIVDFSDSPTCFNNANTTTQLVALKQQAAP